MNSGCLRFLILMAGLATSLTLAAQAPVPSDSDKGFTEMESFQGTVNSSIKVLKLDSTAGYDFNKHFGVFAGLPLYITSASGTTTTTGATSNSTTSGIGNFYLGMAFRAPNPTLNYASTITVGAPTGSVQKGLSSGRGTVDWSNHFDHSFHHLTPFLNAGLANTVPDTLLVTRPFTSLGAVGHFEEGAEYALVRHFAVGGSAYEITPFGNQKVFSKLVQKGQTRTVSGKSHGVFDTAFESSGNGLTRENGVSTWVAFQSSQMWRAQVGYTRSATYALNSFSFYLGVNVGKLLRTSRI